MLLLGLANANLVPAERITAAAGLDQAWSVFAPEPIHHELALEAEVRYVRGGRTLWRPPRRGRALAPFGYRLEAWTRRVVRDADSELWRPAASWIARRHTVGGRRPVSVTLRRRWRAVSAPGRTGRPGVWNEFDFYTLETGQEG